MSEIDQVVYDIMDALETLYAVVDFCIMERDQYVQKWLYNSGHEWAGDPEDEDLHIGVPHHRMYVQNQSWELNALNSMLEDPQRTAEYLEHRDNIVRGVQELLSEKPTVLYLLCMHAEYRLKETAERREIDPMDPPEKYPLMRLYGESIKARELIESIVPDIQKSPEEWAEVYRRHL